MAFPADRKGVVDLLYTERARCTDDLSENLLSESKRPGRQTRQNALLNVMDRSREVVEGLLDSSGGGACTFISEFLKHERHVQKHTVRCPNQGLFDPLL